ncbi:MAG: ABC transporter permease [Candidatus Korarchaeota archaeon]|nr:ABC transporter permease [Candidatus Korarchaeota archaeon]NIU82686.1 FtsX-like permease family protein [Candidatus Thorarchaeota archaeon]NIW13160.1 FtsX-like permease family protein [Candidatus Thorarchaeota archaeon]NIW51261.1 FtsX-like permease family protein [Candidatus Korarchaeota archaeon]
MEETTQSVGMGAGSQLNPNKMAFIPLETLQNQLNISRIHGILSKVDDTDHVDGVADEIRSHFGEDKVDVITSKAILSTVNEILDRIAIFLMAIASVALLVAGFGIMNTMTMSVSERTKEIGILKSIGATNGTILGIFLSEALLMGIAGGILGIGLGYVGGFVLGRFILALMGNPGEFFAEMLVPVLSPMTIGVSVSFALAVVISVIFAYWPSKRAANYDPVKALRFG